MMALQYVHPVNLTAVPAEAIVKCRENLKEELATFRDYVATQQTGLVELAEVPNRRRHLEAFTEHIQVTVEGPLRKLEKGMLLHKLEPTRSLLLTNSVAPPAAIGSAMSLAGAAPAAVVTAGAVTAIGAAWWQIKRARREMTASSPVGYLFDVRDQLTPRTIATRARKVLRGTYSPTGRRTPGQI